MAADSAGMLSKAAAWGRGNVPAQAETSLKATPVIDDEYRIGTAYQRGSHMTESVESFVAKLQQEGIQAGQDAADKLLADANEEAGKIVAQAEAKAGKIIETAEAEAATTLEKSQTDLRLAARDTALRLREALTRAVRTVLAAGAEQPLSDAEFVKTLLHDIVMQYVQADLDGRILIKIDVAPEMQHQLTQWALAHLHEKADRGDVSLDLKGTLGEAGFEYEIEGANIEVTLASVVDALSELVNPNLREMLNQAMAQPAE